jgi:serine protease Do
MNKTLYSLLALSLLAFSPAGAQDTKKDKTSKDKKEIIIEEKSSGKNEKMVIVVDGDHITINGKPADQYKGNKHIVIDDDIVINGDEVHIPRHGRMYMRGFGSKAMLGVVTDKTDKGAQVKEVIKESAAEKAGLKTGDIITSVNGKAVKDHDELVDIISDMKPGEETDLVYLRDGKEKKVKAKLGESKNPMAMAWNMDPGSFNFKYKMDPPMAMVGPHSFNTPGPFMNDHDMWIFRDDRPKYGMSIEDNSDGDGVKVTGLEDDSNAKKAGLQENDIIVGAEGKPVKGIDELKDILADSKDKSSVTFKVMRNGKEETVVVKVPKVIRKAEL